MRKNLHMTNEQLRVLVRIEELLFNNTPFSFEKILEEAKKKPYYHLRENSSDSNECNLSSPVPKQGPGTQGTIYGGKRCSLILSKLLRSLGPRETQFDES